jgi:hypothetical protein
MNKWKGLKSAHVKRLIGCTLALGLLAGTLKAAPLFAGAADKVDLTSACSVTVGASSSTDKEFIDDIAKAKVVIDYYLVAKAAEKKGYDGYTFEVADTFKNDVTIPDNIDQDYGSDEWKKAWNDTWSEQVVKAAEVVKTAYDAGNALTPDESVPAGTKVTGLEAGLYLLIARGENVTDYFEMTKPKDGSDPKLVSVAYTDRYKYSFTPELVSMPTKAPDPATGVIDTTADTPWLYDATVNMKPERETRFGSLKIVKDLLVYEDHDPATFIFNLDAYVDGKLYFSNVYTLTFTSACEEYVLIEDVLPVGAEVTVSEIYGGPIYHQTVTGPQTVTIVADDIVETRFENTYYEWRKRYGAITNHFDPKLDENGQVVLGEDGKPVYEWSKYEDSREEVKKQ